MPLLKNRCLFNKGEIEWGHIIHSPWNLSLGFSTTSMSRIRNVYCLARHYVLCSLWEVNNTLFAYDVSWCLQHPGNCRYSMKLHKMAVEIARYGSKSHGEVRHNSCQLCHRQNIDILLPSITKLLNYSLAEGLVPEGFKNAVVTPLIKKPSFKLMIWRIIGRYLA